VIDSRLSRDDTEIRRRRECQECGKRFTTRERVEDVLPRIVKRDERREDFDRPSSSPASKACAKRPCR
jgi:transcriptional repressor NrdR